MKVIEGGLNEFSRIVQSEQNIERWCNVIFPPPKAVQLNQIRSHEWEDKISDDYVVKAKITIFPSANTKGYTTTTHDVLLTLIEIWRDRGMPDGDVQCGVREIIKRLGNVCSGRSIEAMVTELRCLHRSTIEWTFSFINPSENVPVDLPEMHILSSLSYHGIANKKQIFLVDPDNAKNSIFNDKKSYVLFSLNSRLRESLLNNKTIPVDLSTRRSIKSDRAKCYYGRIDNILCGKHRQYSRTASNLVKDLQLFNIKRYQYKSYRKELCVDLVKSLSGLSLSNGSRIKAWHGETVDGTDWKVNFKAQVTGQTKKSYDKKNIDPVTVEHLIHLMQVATGEMDKNRGLFKILAESQSETMIHRAIGNFKQDVNKENVKTRGGYFVTLLHRLCHEMNGQWYKDCGSHCKERLENRK